MSAITELRDGAICVTASATSLGFAGYILDVPLMVAIGNVACAGLLIAGSAVASIMAVANFTNAAKALLPKKGGGQ